MSSDLIAAFAVAGSTALLIVIAYLILIWFEKNHPKGS